ncbi:hypothetical protein Emag_007140 [Eimeria magna]
MAWAPSSYNLTTKASVSRLTLALGRRAFKVIHRPGAQQKHVNCLSWAPLPPTPTQRPIILDEFLSLSHVAHSARRRMRLLRHRLRHMCAAVRAAGSPAQSASSGSDDDADVQVCPTDSDDDSPTPSAAQLPDNAPSKVIHGGRSIPLPPAVEHLSLQDAQAQDPECQEFLRLARTPRAAWPPHLRHTPLQFCVLHDLVYVRIGIGGHTCSGMFAPTSAAALSASLTPTPPRKWKWLNLPIGTAFELIAIDLFGPLPITRRGNNHILVIIEHHTRWVELVPLPNPTAAQVAQALFNEWISRWGVPRALLSDNGPQFTAELLRQLCTTFGISKLFASPYNPRGNSIVESDMRSLKTTLRVCLQHFRQEWDVVLPAAALASRCTPHSVKRFSPFFLITGQELVFPLSRQWTEPVLHSTGARWLHALWRCRLAVLRSHQRVADANRKLFHKDPHRLEPGMHVALRILAKEWAAQGKFSPAFRGPYVVERVLPTGTTAELVDPVSGTKLLDPSQVLDAPQPSNFSEGSTSARRADRRPVNSRNRSNSEAAQDPTQRPCHHNAVPTTHQEALQHKEIIYLHRRLKAYKGAKKEVWKVAKGLVRLPVERGWTPPPGSLVAKMKGQVEDSPAEEIWDEWPSPFAKLERQWDDIYLADFPEVTATPRWGTPSWTSFLTAFSRQFIARPSARVREVRGWKEIPEYEPEIQPDPNPALGALLAPRARHDEEDSDEVVEARPALPTPASSGVSAELEGSAERSPLPAARAPGLGRAAPQTAPTSPAAPPPGGSGGQRPLSPLSPTMTGAVNALGNFASQGWDFMATRCVWWTLAAAREHRTARENFEYRLQELQWVDNMSRTVAAARAMLTNLPHGQSSVGGLVGRLRQEHLGGPAVTEDQVECLVGFCLSSAKRRCWERRNAAVTSRPVAAPAAPREPTTPAQFAKADQPSASPNTPEETTPPPPLPNLSAEEFRLPESSVTASNLPQQLGMDGLLNGSAGRSPAGDDGVAPVSQEKGSAAELSETEQPAP